MREIVALSVLVAACGGGSAPPAATTTPTTATPERDDDVSRLLADIGMHQVCMRMGDRFLALTAGPAGEGPPTVTGRVRVRSCETEKRGGRLSLKLEGPGWAWVDQSTQALGASFRVRQYVGFDAEITVVGDFDVEWLDERRILSVRLLPASVETRLSPLDGVDAEAEGVWGSILAAVNASITGRDIDEQATERVSTEGADQLRTRLEEGLALGINLCTGRAFAVVGSAKERPPPSAPEGVPDAQWLATERVELHGGGLDVAGPFAPDGSWIEARVTASEPVESRLMCADDARGWVDAFVRGNPLPEAPAIDRARPGPDAPATLRAEDADCPVVLVTRLEGGERARAEIGHTVTTGADLRSRTPELVECR